MAEVGYASLGIIPSFDGFASKLERGTTPGLISAGRLGGTKFGDAAGVSAGKRFGLSFGTAAKASLAGAAGAGYLAYRLGKDAVDQASDLNESLNAVNVTYGKQSKAVKRLGREAAESLGLSNTEFNGMAVRFSSFASTISGGDGKKTVKTLDDLTTRATDFASVMNLEVGEANDLFASALAGESEPVRRFGIDLSAASVQAYAYANGIAKSGEDLTAAQKVQATYGSLMEQTKKTQGDFANTSDQLANSQRILNAKWDDAQAQLGTALLPILTDVTNFVIDKGIPAFEDFSDWFVKDGMPAISDFIDDAKPLAEDVLPAIESAFKTSKRVASDLAPLLEGVFEGFNKLPDWVQSVIVLGAGAAALKAKLGGGKGGLAGGLLGGVSSLKPIPVFVTNQGFGGAGTGGGVAGAGAKGGATVAGGKVGFFQGLSLLGAASYPDTIPLEEELGITEDQIVDTAKEARVAFNQMSEDGRTSAAELERYFNAFKEEYGDDFDYLSFKARQTMQHIQDATPRQLQTELVVLGVDRAFEAVEVALAPFMVGRNAPKESAGSDHMLPAPSDVPSRGRRTSGGGGGVTINQHIGTVNDSKQLNKDAAAKAQQAAMGGWG